VALLLVPGAMAAVFFPMMSWLGIEGRDHQSRELFRFNFWANILVTAIPAIALAISARWLLGLSGTYYAHGLAPFLVLMAATVPSALNNVLSSASLSLGAIRAWLISDLVLAVAFIGTAMTIVPLVGATGLALAYLAGYLASDAALARPVLVRLGRSRRMIPALAGSEPA
jgi:O-antigen/teichoic acid export membrane protein